MPPVKLVIDTNTLVSGTLWSGPPSRLIEALEHQQASLILSAPLLTEFAEVIGRGHLASRLAACNVTPHKLVIRLIQKAEFVSPAFISLPAALRDPKDLIVLATAVAARADAMVSGDEDLLVLKSFEGIPILKVTETLERLGLSI
jgi:putative PIN family toxin of toxin-antitoxin system